MSFSYPGGCLLYEGKTLTIIQGRSAGGLGDLRAYYNSRPGSSVYFGPKGMPEDALGALRQAFGKIWADPQFGRDYERLTAEPLEPITGGEIEKFLQDIPEDSKVRTVMQQVLGAGAVPAAR